MLHICEVRVRSYFLLISCFFLQGFDDQPGVESQRLLSAQRRHHLLQSISIQLDDLQVEAESSIPPTPQLKFLSCPSSTSLDSVPIAQPVSNRTEACLHKQKTKNKKNLRQKNKEKQRPCTILKGWFLHKGHIFFMPGTWAGQQFESEISRMFVCAVSHVGGKVKGREMRCVCLCGSGSWKKQYSHPGSYGTEWTHWRRCYIYAFTSAPTEYSTETTHTSFLCARWKNWMCCYIQTPLHMHTNIRTFEDMQKFTVFAILPEGFVQIWWIVYRSKCLWAV